jgi:O-acetylhomoserine (thiol)-lyase
MPGYAAPGFDTLALHAGAPPHKGNAPSTTPSTSVLEQRLAALEGGVAALALPSGPCALHRAIASIMGSGGHIVASTGLPSNLQHLLQHTLPHFGIHTSFVQVGDVDAWRAAIRTSTRLLLGATLSQPSLEVLDIAAIAQIAHEADVPFLVDSTCTPPWLLHPLAHGADMVLHASPHFLSGHSHLQGAVLVDDGSFDWSHAFEASGKFAELAAPCADADGTNYSEESSVGAWILRARHDSLHTLGSGMDARTAQHWVHGLETLSLRLQRQQHTMQTVLQFLVEQPFVERVQHPQLDNHPSHALASTLLPRGAGSVLGMVLKGSPAQAGACVAALRLMCPNTALGGNRSSASYWGNNTVGLSIGLEDADDLLDDLQRALKTAQRAP